MPIQLDEPLTYEVQAALDRANLIDLAPIKRKLTDEQHGLAWSAQRADDAEKLYRCFLALQILYAESEQRIVPPSEVDLFWHQHILDTRKYAMDCDLVLGRFLHHFPYFGMRGPDDERALFEAATWSISQFRSCFGDSIGQLLDSSSCSSSCGKCSSCKAD